MEKSILGPMRSASRRLDNMKKFIQYFLCRIGYHKPIQRWSEHLTEREGVFGGFLSPYTCKSCGYKSQVFKIPPPPERKRHE